MPKIRSLKKSERVPVEFWEDQKWTFEHYAELRREYADTWVAIVNKEVVAFGEKLTEKKEKTIRKEIGRPFVTFFVEGEERGRDVAQRCGGKRNGYKYLGDKSKVISVEYSISNNKMGDGHEKDNRYC